MASSFYSNDQHVDFESVLGMDDRGMVSMFEALIASGLRGFLGCPAVVYEDALVDFFENASVRSGVVISTVGARQEVRTLDDVHTIRFNEFRKNILTQNASIFQGLADVRQVVEAVNAKVDIMASRLNAIQKDAEATKEALSHQLLEFQSSAQENHNVIHAQLSELVDYIHRGSADKKGESGSRGLQKPANTQKEGSDVTPTFVQRVQMAQRRIVQTVLDADANRDAAERDRERRRKEAKSISFYSSKVSSWSIREISADDVVISTREYSFESQRVLLKIAKRQRFDKLERHHGVHCFVSADEVISSDPFSGTIIFARQPCDVAPSATHGRAQGAALSAHRPASSGALHAPSSPTSAQQASPEQLSPCDQRPISSREEVPSVAQLRATKSGQRADSRVGRPRRTTSAAQRPTSKHDGRASCIHAKTSTNLDAKLRNTCAKEWRRWPAVARQARGRLRMGVRGGAPACAAAPCVRVDAN
ncbi:hypothetical protein F511_16123 [Dorcoceras hygrometricum]|uniref:ICln family transporter: chloride ion current inducer protein I(Cln) n=1 Tax=Dorcoceras hygrometricum TaxID=472368 RepID=A0A2Z7D1C6_9LAMI|nr:hypothetical protein F511_16123 [Dorcoceras hygrometricum]